MSSPLKFFAPALYGAAKPLSFCLDPVLAKQLLTPCPDIPITDRSNPIVPASWPRRRFLQAGAGVATAAALVATVDEFYPIVSLAADQSSATGQRRRLTLQDGSEIVIDARTRVNIDFAAKSRSLDVLAGAIALWPAQEGHRPDRPFEIRT